MVGTQVDHRASIRQPTSRPISALAYIPVTCDSAHTPGKISRINLPSTDTLEHIVNRHSAMPIVLDKDPPTVDVPREFHRRMAVIIDAVQTGIWQEGVHDLLGYATDYAFGQKRGVQTLVLKNRLRSAYVRLHWDTLMSDTVADRQQVDEIIQNAIRELR